MKKIFIAFAAILFAGFAFAQTPVNPFPKTITVNGSAEMEIIPDEIYVQVDLKEYDKKGQGKVEKPTLGDLGALAQIKEKLQQEEKGGAAPAPEAEG